MFATQISPEVMESRIRVGIVDDHPTIFIGLAGLINAHPGMLVSATGRDVDELLAPEAPFDIVLLDLALADGSTPTENVTRLLAEGAKVIIYSVGDRPRLVREAAHAGAMGMVRKAEAPLRIVAAIESVFAGDVTASADWASALEADSEFVSADLSDREAEVLTWYASGDTAERVARRLCITRQAVNEHIRSIRAKYMAADRPAQTKIDLYHRAVEDGLI